MAVKSGLDAETVVEVLNAGSGRNSAAQAEALGLDLPTARTVAAMWEKAAEEIGPDADFTRIVEIAERPAGVQIRRRANHQSAA